MGTFSKFLGAAGVVAIAMGGLADAQAAKKKSNSRKFTPAMKQASMGKARAMCMEARNRKGKQFIRAEITDEGRLYCWYR